MSKQILITGASGYLGLRLAQLAGGASLWIHANNGEELSQKAKAIRQRFPDETAYTVSGGDLTEDDPLGSLNPGDIGAIIHSAAVTRFNVEEETARRVNIEGARKVMQFARRCPGLQSFSLLSTIYSSGLQSGVIDEQPLEGVWGFSNFYEWSKHQAEILLLREFADLPWRIFRIATVIADNESGCVTQQNAFHNTLKLMYYGLLSLVPGKKETPLYFVTGEFAANSIMELLQSSGIYHVSHRQQESITLGELMDTVFETFQDDEEFRRRRVLRPLYSDEESFGLLAGAVTQFSSPVVSQAVSSVTPFSRQLYIMKDVRNDRLADSLKSYHAPDPQALICSACRYLIHTRWGRR